VPCSVRGMARVLALSLLSFFLFCVASSGAHASPRAIATDDALADGEVDPEDLVARATVGRAVRPLPASRSHAWLSLVGFAHQNTITAREEVGGMLVVGLPLDRVARPST